MAAARERGPDHRSPLDAGLGSGIQMTAPALGVAVFSTVAVRIGGGSLSQPGDRGFHAALWSRAGSCAVAAAASVSLRADRHTPMRHDILDGVTAARSDQGE